MLLQDWKQENPGPYTELHLNFTQHKTKKLLSEYQFLYITSIKESYPAQLTGIYPTNKIQDLQNYINLSPVAIPNKDVKSVDFKPLGVGSGMIGLPGDFTPPSRFVRAVAFTATARNTSDGPETVYEIFRILDNFNVPLSATWGVNNPKQPKDLRSSTLWTVAYDTKNKVMYYHTQNNRRVRMVDLSKIDFASLPAVIHQPLDEKKAQDIEDRTPK